jgi:hypothetical protein
MLFWNKAEPSSELTTGAEDFCVDDGGSEGGRRDEADSGNG